MLIISNCSACWLKRSIIFRRARLLPSAAKASNASRSRQSAAGAEEIRARGYAALGPTDFERPVTMPDGTQSAAKFRTFQWPIEEAPAGLHIFACQHKTRETVWIPELMKHANGAKRLKQALIVSIEPAKDAAHLGRLIDREVKTEPDGAVAVRSEERL